MLNMNAIITNIRPSELFSKIKRRIRVIATIVLVRVELQPFVYYTYVFDVLRL